MKLDEMLESKDIDYTEFMSWLAEKGKDDIVDEIDTAYNDAWRYGAEGEMSKQFVTDVTTENDYGAFVIMPDKSPSQRFELWLNTSVIGLRNLFSTEEEFDYSDERDDLFTFGFDESRNTWSDFDREYFNTDVIDILVRNGIIEMPKVQE